MISTGKICATVAGLAAVILVISQLQLNNGKDDVVENWGGLPTFRPNMMTVKRGANQKGKSLLSDLPDSTFFMPTASYQPRTVIGATNVIGNTVSAGGPLMNLQPGLGVQAGLNSTFENFEAAANMVENYHKQPLGPGGQHNLGPGGQHKKPHRNLGPGGTRRVPPANPTGCGPAGTIASGYGMSNLVGADFDALSGPQGQPRSSMLEGSGTSYASELPVASMEGNVGASFNTARMVYSTLSRAQCSGTRDLIRGDLPITPCGQYMQTAARAADTLSTGAMAAMFGIDGNTSMRTSQLVTADASAGGLTALAGMNLADLVVQPKGQAGISSDTFASTSAEVVANAYTAQNVANSRMVGANPTNGDVMGISQPASLYTGYTSFA